MATSKANWGTGSLLIFSLISSVKIFSTCYILEIIHEVIYIILFLFILFLLLCSDNRRMNEMFTLSTSFKLVKEFCITVNRGVEGYYMIVGSIVSKL